MPGPVGELLKSGFNVVGGLIKKVGGGAVLAATDLAAIAANTIVANVTGSSAQPTAAAPQSLIFTDATASGGNTRGKVAPEQSPVITALATAGNTDKVITLTENGRYRFFVEVVLKLSGGAYRTVAYVVVGSRVSGTLTLEGTPVLVEGGDPTNVTVTITAATGNLNVNVAQATGSTCNGNVHVGWFIRDLVA